MIPELESTIHELYRSICFEQGQTPHPEKLHELFIGNGLLINNQGEQPVVMSVEQFIAGYREALAGGAIQSLEEKEIHETTEVFGKVAHRFSTYRLFINGAPVSKGVNTIQLIKQDGKWLVSSMAWNDIGQ